MKLTITKAEAEAVIEALGPLDSGDFAGRWLNHLVAALDKAIANAEGPEEVRYIGIILR